jgi:hypothetical protein
LAVSILNYLIKLKKKLKLNEKNLKKVKIKVVPGGKSKTKFT